MTERDGQIASLNQAMTERDGQIASLSQAVTERDGQIAGLVHQLKLIQSSKSWALTRPLRYLQRLTQKGKIIAQAQFQGLSTIMKSIRQYGLIQTTTLAVHRVGLSRNRRYSKLTEPRKTFGPKTLRDSRPRKITVVSMLKNEKNIIETFAAHALAMFDRVIFIDHRSTDGTQEYLQHLASVYPQVEVFVFDEEGYYQSEAMTWVVTKLIGAEDDGWVFFLDSDEFLPFSSRLEFEAELERHAAFPVISLPWLNLVPLQMEGVWTKRGKFLKPSKPAAHHKIAFQPSLIPFDEFAVAQGNHALLIGRHFRHPFPAEEAFSIYHLPVRTKSQLRDKIRHGVEAYKKMGSDRERGLGVHWDEINDLIGNNGITDEIMIDIIVRYGEPLSPPYGKSIKELRNQGYSEIELNVCVAQDLPKLVDFVRAEKINHSNLTERHVQIGATSKRGMRIMLDAEKSTLRFHG
jgi:glycosyltransferase involved in cell wall biosynthesis